MSLFTGCLEDIVLKVGLANASKVYNFVVTNAVRALAVKAFNRKSVFQLREVFYSPLYLSICHQGF